MGTMSVAEVANSAEVTDQSVRTWVKKGLLTPEREGTRLVFDEKQVREFLGTRSKTRRRGRPTLAEDRMRASQSLDEADKVVVSLRTAMREATRTIKKQQSIIHTLSKRADSAQTTKRDMLEQIAKALEEQSRVSRA